MMKRVFIDTDVILDLFLRREPHHRQALRFFSHLKKKGIEGYTSPIVLANTYYILAKLKSRRYATGKLKKLRNIIRIASVSEATIDAALRAGLKDFEDSIQYHCALEQGLKVLITRNIRDYPQDKLHILLPTEYLKMTVVEPTTEKKSGEN